MTEYVDLVDKWFTPSDEAEESIQDQAFRILTRNEYDGHGYPLSVEEKQEAVRAIPTALEMEGYSLEDANQIRRQLKTRVVQFHMIHIQGLICHHPQFKMNGRFYYRTTTGIGETIELPPTQVKGILQAYGYYNQAPLFKKKKAKKVARPVKCSVCGRATGRFALGNPKSEYVEEKCDICIEAGKIVISGNSRLIKHISEQDNLMVQGTSGQELLGCDRCHASSGDMCTCCTYCGNPPNMDHHGHKYEPKGTTVRREMGLSVT